MNFSFFVLMNFLFFFPRTEPVEDDPCDIDLSGRHRPLQTVLFTFVKSIIWSDSILDFSSCCGGEHSRSSRGALL